VTKTEGMFHVKSAGTGRISSFLSFARQTLAHAANGRSGRSEVNRFFAQVEGSLLVLDPLRAEGFQPAAGSAF
jgi:hypothetical protein